jgi:hypothetical protein
MVRSKRDRWRGHLNVFARGDPTKVFSIKFSCGREDDGLGGHVDSDGEGLRGEEALD